MPHVERQLDQKLAEVGLTIRELRGFSKLLWEAGIEAYPESWEKSGGLIVNGRSVWAQPRGPETWNDAFDRVISETAIGHLEAAVQENLPLRGLGLVTRRGPNSIQLIDGDGDVLADILATQARIPSDGDVVHGYFLNAGPDWDRLLVSLPLDPARSAHVLLSRPPTRILRSLSLIPPALHPLVIAASSRLKTERSIAFGHAVQLSAEAIKLRIEPLRIRSGAREIPFVSATPRGILAGAIEVDTTDDPLHCAEFFGTDEVGHAWATALIGAAELLCVVSEEPEPPTDLRWRRPARQPAANEKALNGRRFRAGTGLVHPQSMTPIGETAEIAAHYVVGHRRLLTPPKSASKTALADAAKHKISLGPSETWVRPHARGLPKDATLTFTWSVPTALRDALLDASSLRAS